MGTKYRIEMTKYPYQGNIDKSYNTNSFIKFIFNLVILFVLMVFKKYDIVDISIRVISKKDKKKETERHDTIMRGGRRNKYTIPTTTINADKIKTDLITSISIDNIMNGEEIEW